MNQLPETTQTEELPQVAIDIPEEVIAEEDAIKILRQHGGFVQVRKDSITELAKVGAFARGTGTINTQRGRVLVSQHRLDAVMLMLIREMERVSRSNTKDVKGKVAMLTRLAEKIGQLTSRMTDTQKLALDIDGFGKTRNQMLKQALTDDAMPTQKALPPGMDARPRTMVVGREVHIHNSPAPDPNQVPPC